MNIKIAEENQKASEVSDDDFKNVVEAFRILARWKREKTDREKKNQVLKKAIAT